MDNAHIVPAQGLSRGLCLIWDLQVVVSVVLTLVLYACMATLITGAHILYGLLFMTLLKNIQACLCYVLVVNEKLGRLDLLI
jgi:hypothetical protein